MALISCPDCGREVSSLAPACPGCARPIAEDVGTRAAERRAARGDEEAESDAGRVTPGILARRHRDRVGARAPGVVKACLSCGRDVTEDLFRQKRNLGYICAECQDKEIDAYVAWRNRWGRLVWIGLAVLVVGVSIVCLMTVVTSMTTTKTDAVDPVKK